MKTTGLLLLALACAGPALAQRGCPDPQATNYDPAARANDGSCRYPPAATAVLTKALLDAAVPETSGLQLAGGALWTFNDSGNPPVLFRLDSASGRATQRVRVVNFPNVDWEDITADAGHLYVGDFGNNSGDRRDLRVLRVPLAGPLAGADTVSAQAINFSFPDQTVFGGGVNNHNFDCEALFYRGDSLHLFTKDWADHRTRYYTVPAAPGTHVAHLKATFDVQGLITAADIRPDGRAAALLGYDDTTGATFAWLLTDFAGTNFFGGNKRRIELPSALLVGQAEGLCFAGPARLLLSNERVAVGALVVPPRLYALNVGPWLPRAVVTATASPGARLGLRVFPSPAAHLLRIERAAPGPEVALTLLDLRGRAVATGRLRAGATAQALDVAAVAAGVYVLRAQSAAGTLSQKVAIR
ncbi:T9SS type A sorting domain-containing protein [Hymenobacter caeli]|uniref:Secretion system C-terminal sorting domain-containing protein n=1 Tax=Hymenobacter caeli TaxID=2735894 RepID=A0ABX2FYE6_9BACT|nr:T9SS type A sorting domain-containing protein [Hymenobacter caeli]NRT21422.1 hypothetical protein [Hymenobacter caeli]